MKECVTTIQMKCKEWIEGWLGALKDCFLIVWEQIRSCKCGLVFQIGSLK